MFKLVAKDPHADNFTYPPELVEDERAVYYGGNYAYGGTEYSPNFRGRCGRSGRTTNDHVTPTDYQRFIFEVTRDEPYSYEVSAYGGNIKQKYTVHPGSRLGNPSYWNVPDSVVAARDNAFAYVNTALRLKLRDAKNFNVGVALAEARQTVDLLAQSASSLWKLLLAIKTGNIRDILDTLGGSRNGVRDILSGRSGANRWLEYQYGWKPLMSDVYSAYEALSAQKDKKMLLKVSKTGTFSGELEHDFSDKEHWEGSIKRGVTASIESEGLRNMDQWGLLNPLSVAWEVLPYSFVIDWGIPVGNVLDSLSATAGLHCESGYYNLIHNGTRTRTCPYTPFNDGDNAISITDNGYHEIKKYDFVRTADGGFPPAQLYGKGNPFSSAHVKNALALFRKLF